MIINTITHGDVLKTLAEISSSIIDLSITSPPYNKGEKNKGRLADKVTYDSISDAMPEDEYQKNQIEVLNEVFRVTKPTGHFFYNHKIRWNKGTLIHPIEWLRRTKWTIRQEIIWNRTIATNIRGWRFWQLDERIYWLQKAEGIGRELESKHGKFAYLGNSSGNEK